MTDAMQPATMPDPSPRTSAGRWLSRQRLLATLPFVIAAVALLLRLQGIDWDGGAFYHPDERSIYLRAEAMYSALTEAPGWESQQNRDFPLDTPGIPSIGTFFDKDASPLNPHWFPLGTIIIYILVVVRAILEPLMDQVRLQDLASAGRTIAAMADAGSVLLLYFLGKRLFGWRVGLLASVLLAFSVINIQVTHFYRPESFVILLALASFWWMFNVLEHGRRRDHVVLGVVVGLSFAFRASGTPLLVPVLVTYGVLAYRRWKESGVTPAGSVVAVLPMAVMAGAVAFATFAVLQPYALLDYRTFFGNLGWEVMIAREAGKVPYTVQYVGTPRNLTYEITQSSVWALGLPLGVVAWMGLAVTVVRSFFRQHLNEILLIAWVVPLILTISQFEVKFLRYIVPVLPVMVLLGCHWLVVAYERAKAANAMVRARAVIAIGAFVVVATVWYALAFVGIYAEPHPGVQASRWANENVAPGSVVLTDNHWDEGFPNLGRFRVSQLPMYEGDDVGKVQRVSQMLADGDYIMAYSNRPWGSIARLPERYPYSSNYYHALFEGSLGYELVQAFERYPSFLGVTWVHDPFTRATVERPETLPGAEPSGLALNLGWADENVVDYDHPLVLVWRNVNRLSQAEIGNIMFGAGGDSEQRAMLSDEAFAEQRAGGTWSDIFSEGGLNGAAPWLVWLLAIELIAWLTVPLAVKTLRWLPDCGVVLARPLGLLLVAWFVWLGASLGMWSFGRTSIIWAIVLLALVSGVIFLLDRRRLVELARTHWKYLASLEALFIVAYVVFVLIRAANPDLWHPYRGGEKPMDLSYLTAVARSVSFPPYDPWYAGGYINYYYFGFVPIAALMRLTGIVPAVAYNLAVPMLFAITLTAAFSVGFNLADGLRERMGSSVSRWTTLAAGGATALLVAVLANLDGAAQLLQGLGRTLGDGDFGRFDFWRSSRLMPGQISITEFPFWSFLFADLHAHMISIPFQVTTVGLAANLVLGANATARWIGRMPGIFWLALFVGAFSAINTWDVPAYGLLALGTLAIVVLVAERNALSFKTLGRYVVLAAGFWAATYVLWLPFHADYDSVFAGTFASRWRTVAWHYMAIHGLFFFIVVSWLAVEAYRRVPVVREAFGRTRPSLGEFRASPLNSGITTIVLALVALGLALALWVRYPALHQWTTVAVLTLVAAVALAVAGTWLAKRSSSAMPVQVFVLGMLVIALGIGIGVDFITAERDIDRMNTVFKFYLNAWVLWGIVAGVAAWQLYVAGALRMAGRWRYANVPWLVVLALLVMSTAVFPILGTRARIADRFDTNVGLTLNGTAFMESSVYHDPGPSDRGIEENARYALAADLDALEYIQQNVDGTPVFLEAVTNQYRWTPRVALYTGNPVVVGWEWHQVQQRGAGGTEPFNVRARINDVRRAYGTTSLAEIRQLLDKYGVEYVYLGPTERLYFPASGLAKFDEAVGDFLEVFYDNDGVTVYRVVREGGLPGDGPDASLLPDGRSSPPEQRSPVMDTVTLIRDILISVYLVGGILLTLAVIVFAFLLFMSFRGLIGITKRTASNFEKVSEAAVEHIAKPLEEGVSAGSVAGNMAGFATGFVAGMRGRRSKQKEEEKKKRRRRIPFL